MYSLWQDVRFSWRALTGNLGFSVIAVSTLALGIGANSAIFSLVNAVMLQSLPVRDPEQLIVPRWSSHNWPQNTGTSGFGDCAGASRLGPNAGGCSFSYPFLKELRAQRALFSNVAGFAGPAQLDVTGNGSATIARGELVSGDYFQTLGVLPAVGRTIEPSDEQTGASVVVLNYEYWQQALGGTPAAIGKNIRVNNIVFTIIGVAEPRFGRLTPGKSIDFWLPLTHMVPLGLNWGSGSIDSANWWLTLIARLRPETKLAYAQAAVSVLFRNETLHAERPALKDADDPEVALVPAQNALSGIRATLGKPLYLSMTASAMVLVIACANLAGLMLARATARQKGIAVRLALGSTRRRIVQQLLTESLMLSVTGAAFGAVLAFGVAKELAKLLSASSRSPLVIDFRPDATVFAFDAGIALLAGIGFGLIPALYAARSNISAALKTALGRQMGPSDVRIGRFSSGGLFVVTQVALSTVVLVGAALFMRTLDKLRHIDPGFDTQNVLLFSIDAVHAGYSDRKVQQIYDEIDQRLLVLPGVVSASYSSFALLDGGLWTESIRIDESGRTGTGEVQMMAIGPDYFDTLRVPLLRGHNLSASDLQSGQSLVVVNQNFVQQFLKSRDPIGLRFQVDNRQQEIIGVVGNTKYSDLRSDNAPTVFTPFRTGDVTFIVRSAGTPSGVLVPEVRSAVSDVDDNLPVFAIRTQSEAVDRLLVNERLITRLISMFAFLALLLTCSGLFGLLSYNVTRRRKEIGIRTALGAQQGDVLTMVIEEGLWLVAFGTILGILISSVATRYIQSLLYGIHPMDPLSLVVVMLIIGTLALIACYIPAKAAVRVDPIVVLRDE